MWRPTPLYRAKALENYLGTPAEIYFKYEANSPTGSHKLNSALAQCYLAKLSGVEKLITDTGAAQWGSALAMAGQMFGIEIQVHMIRSSYYQKPYRRYLMETYGATVYPSPGDHTEFGRSVLADDPDNPGSEGIAVSEALEEVRKDPRAKYAMGAFSNHNLLHQTVIGQETKKQMASIGRDPEYLIASVGCGSNMGGFVFPWLPDQLDGLDVSMIASEPEACATLTRGEYRTDFADATGKGPMVRTYTLGHEFVPPEIHAGGLRYHGCAPLIGLAKDEGLISSVAHPQTDVFKAGKLFASLFGFVPAPEACHPLCTAIEKAQECKRMNHSGVIVVNYSGHGLLDLPAYDRFNQGQLEDYRATGQEHQRRRTDMEVV